MDFLSICWSETIALRTNSIPGSNSFGPPHRTQNLAILNLNNMCASFVCPATAKRKWIAISTALYRDPATHVMFFGIVGGLFITLTNLISTEGGAQTMWS